MARPEDQIQRACVQWLDIQVAMGRLKFTAIPLGEKRSRVTAAILVGLGARKGAPDLVIALPNGVTLWAELKRQKGGKTSKEQVAWRDALRALGHEWVLVRSLDDMIDAVAEHGGYSGRLGAAAGMVS